MGLKLEIAHVSGVFNHLDITDLAFYSYSLLCTYLYLSNITQGQRNIAVLLFRSSYLTIISTWHI
jgi:hypothetical protein